MKTDRLSLRAQRAYAEATQEISDEVGFDVSAEDIQLAVLETCADRLSDFPVGNFVRSYLRGLKRGRLP